jgi:L-lactate dehydrogenase complex protein LldG
MARSDRQSFLAEVRRALVAGQGSETRSALAAASPREESPEREELADQFVREARAAEAEVTRVASLDDARVAVRELVSRLGAVRIVQGETDGLRKLGLRGDELEISTVGPDAPAHAELRTLIAAAEVGLTEADYGIAESGTLALLHRPGQGRALSVLPPVHVAVVRVADLVPDLAALFQRLGSDSRHPASALTFITGPSRTGDIEFVLTKGVHGPGEVYIFLVEED